MENRTFPYRPRAWLSVVLLLASCSSQAERDFPGFLAERAVVLDVDATEMCCITVGDVHDALQDVGSDVQVRQIGTSYAMTVRGTPQGDMTWYFGPSQGGGYLLTRIDSAGYQIANAGGVGGYANTNQLLIEEFPSLTRDEVGTAQRRATGAQRQAEREAQSAAQQEQLIAKRQSVMRACDRASREQFSDGNDAFRARIECMHANGY